MNTEGIIPEFTKKLMKKLVIEEKQHKYFDEGWMLTEMAGMNDNKITSFYEKICDVETLNRICQPINRFPYVIQKNTFHFMNTLHNIFPISLKMIEKHPKNEFFTNTLKSMIEYNIPFIKKLYNSFSEISVFCSQNKFSSFSEVFNKMKANTFEIQESFINLLQQKNKLQLYEKTFLSFSKSFSELNINFHDFFDPKNEKEELISSQSISLFQSILKFCQSEIMNNIDFVKLNNKKIKHFFSFQNPSFSFVFGSDTSFSLLSSFKNILLFSESELVFNFSKIVSLCKKLENFLRVTITNVSKNVNNIYFLESFIIFIKKKKIDFGPH